MPGRVWGDGIRLGQKGKERHCTLHFAFRMLPLSPGRSYWFLSSFGVFGSFVFVLLPLPLLSTCEGHRSTSALPFHLLNYTQPFPITSRIHHDPFTPISFPPRQQTPPPTPRSSIEVHVSARRGKLRVALDDLVDRVHEVLLRNRLLAGAVVFVCYLLDVGWR